MSKISLAPNASGTGNFTIASPNGNTDRTLTLPDQTGTVLTGSGAIGVNASAPTSSVNIDSSGNVGIGTSSPSSKLHVAGAGSTIRNAASSGSSWFVGSNVDSYILHNESNTPMVFTTNGTERMRIDTVGQNTMNTTIGYAQLRNVTNTTVATGGTVDFPSMSGILIVNNYSQGTVVIFSCGGGVVSTVNTNGLYPGTVAYNAGINGYRWTANSPAGTTHTYSFTLIATRPTA